MSKAKQALKIAQGELANSYPGSTIEATGRRVTVTPTKGNPEIVYVRYSSQHPDPDRGFNFSKLRSRPGDEVQWLIVWFDKDPHATKCRLARGKAVVTKSTDGSYFRVPTDGRGNLRDGTTWSQALVPQLTD